MTIDELWRRLHERESTVPFQDLSGPSRLCAILTDTRVIADAG